MRTFAIALGTIVAAAGVAVAALRTGAGQDDEQHQGFKPGKEHEYLKQLEGTWEAAGKWWFVPGGDPMESTGTQTAKLSLGGLWLVFDFEGELMGKYQGHGCQGYDPVKKKYVMTWIDSVFPMVSVGEGTLDEAGKVLTMDLEGRDFMSRKPTKDRWVSETRDADTRVFTFLRLNAAGKYDRLGEIVYKRKK